MRLGRTAAFAAVVGLGALTGSAASATTPPAEPSVPSAGSTPPTTVAPGVVAGPTPPRGGSAAGGLVHDTSATDWDLREVATSAALALAALAAAGHLYGRLQSTTPRVGRAIADPSPSA